MVNFKYIDSCYNNTTTICITILIMIVYKIKNNLQTKYKLAEKVPIQPHYKTLMTTINLRHFMCIHDEKFSAQYPKKCVHDCTHHFIICTATH